MKKFKNIMRIILISFTAIVIGLKLYSWNAETLVGNAMPMPFGYGSAVVLSGSMEPELSVNDVIIVHDDDSYKIGDVVVYQKGSELIVHRIIDIDDETITTKGDANNTSDEPINKKNIKGTVVFTIPFVGIIVNFLKSTVGIIILIIGAFFLMEMSFRRKKEQDNQDIDAIKAEIRRLKNEHSTESE